MDPRDVVWDAVVSALLPLGAVETPSRWADKPALRLGRREIAQHEGEGLVDLRITAAGWREVAPTAADDPRIERTPSRRDWIVLRLRTAADVAAVQPLLEVAARRNS